MSRADTTGLLSTLKLEEQQKKVKNAGMHVVKGAIMANYRMTPKRRAALRKAQKISARKRRGKGKGKLAAANRRATRNKRIALATGGLFGAAMAAGYVKGKRSNSYKNKKGVKNWFIHAPSV